MASIINASTSAGLITSADTSGVLQLQNNGTVAVTVTGGNVGIGITPAVALQVYNSGGGTTARFQTGTTASGNFVDFYNATGTRQGYLGTVDGTGNIYLHNDANANLYFDTNNTTNMTLNGSGNLGLGVTPSAHASSTVALQFPSYGVVAGGAGYNALSTGYNFYFNGGYKYIANGYATMYQSGGSSGIHTWNIAANNSSGAGASLTFTQAMTLDAIGRLLVGSTSPSITSSQKFEANGAGAFLVSSTTVSALYLQNSDATAATNQPYLYINDGNANRGAVGLVNSTSQLFINGQAGIAFRYGGSGVGTTEAARIDSSGNLLVGTTNNNGFSGGAITAATSFNGYKKTFTNLSTTPQSTSVAATTSGAFICHLKSVGGASVSWIMGVYFDTAGIYFQCVALGGCSASGAGISVTNNDGRTYTFTRNGSDGYLYIQASSTATGTTTFSFTPLDMFL